MSKMRIRFAPAHRVLLVALLIFARVDIKAQSVGRELIQDPHFQEGFILWKPEPGKHVRYGELKSFDGKASPVWGLDQWSSKFPLDAALPPVSANGALVYSNAAKCITLGARGSDFADITLAVNTGPEYGARVRQSVAEPWVHLLVEQEFESPAALESLAAAKFHVEARLLRSQLLLAKDYNPSLHAAQFTIYFTVQNRNTHSRGHGDLLWFGIPVYDNRARFPAAFQEQDFGGTAKFIYTPGGRQFTSASAHDGAWIVIDKDILPMMREALAMAWSRGFLKDSHAIADYSIGGMNMGWELPGSFDVSMQIRDLSLKVMAK